MLGFGPFELHRASRQLRRDGRPVGLRASAFEILLALLERPGEVVAKRLLCERAWPGRDVDENNLQVEISALRKLIGAAAIVTASGRGYQFALAVTGAPTADETPVGRDEDLAALQRLLAPGELVNVVGEGGIGKSRLAQALVQRDSSACVARLDEAHDDAGVLHAVGAASGLRDVSRTALFEALNQAPRLLLLDTCEAALQPVAELAGAVMAECPGASLLATSREVLRVPGERVYRLAPLAGDAALQLFSQLLGRAGESGAADLCRQLEGNPLAIELAASHVARVGVCAALQQVEQRLSWQAEPHSATPARQRSLRDSLDWSWRALSSTERQLLVALSALPQPFGLDALLAMPCTPVLDRWERMELLGRLADKSLVAVDESATPLYRMSSTTRLYARQALT
jgi:predicted ATPase/DNA-binding winged helix-turn-helix (wHTH) protein